MSPAIIKEALMSIDLELLNEDRIDMLINACPDKEEIT